MYKKPLDKKAKIIVVKPGVPFREGTDVHKRASAVMHNGRTVADALRRGARTSTVRWLLSAKRIRLSA